MQTPNGNQTEPNHDYRNPKGQNRSPNRSIRSDGGAGLPGSRQQLFAGRRASGGDSVGLPASARAASLLVAELARAVADELESRGLAASPSTAPAVLDRRGLAASLGVGLDTVDRLRREGCPELTVGDAPRFELPAVLGWLRGRRE